MKARALALAAALAAVGSASSAAADDVTAMPPRWTVQVDPLTTALGFVHVQLERRLDPELSFYVGPHLRLYDSVFTDEDEPFVGYGVEVGVRWFPHRRAPAGWWVGARAVAAQLSTETPIPETATGGYASALGGYTWILGDRWVLALGAGIQYLHYTVGEYGTEGVLPAAHTAVGVAF